MAIDRRGFIRRGAHLTGGLMAGSLILDLSACGSDEAAPVPDPEEPDAGEVLLGLYRTTDISDPVEAVRQALKSVDLGWLESGQSVLVKLACNSGSNHPSVTSPAAVTALCGALFDAGAGRVVVADQAGVDGVRLVEGDKRFGSTRALTEQNGLLAAIEVAGAEPHFFDEQTWAGGYFEATPPAGSHWSQPLMLPGIIREVDHIVYLPRLSSHILAGCTHGLKTAVGWLRDDSRYHMHNDAASFHEKYTEINYTPEIADRFRLVLTFAESLLLHAGPDDGTHAIADPRIVIASTSLANHDAVSAAILAHVNSITDRDESFPLQYGDTANGINSIFLTTLVEATTGLPWGGGGEGYTKLVAHRFHEGIEADHALVRAFEITGGLPASIPVRLDGVAPAPDLADAIEAYGKGTIDTSSWRRG